MSDFNRPDPIKRNLGKNDKKKPEPAKPTPAPRNNGEYDESVLFWDEWETDKFDKEGKAKKEFKYSYQKGIRFLLNNGFGKIKLENNSYQFVRVRENIVQVVTPRLIKEYMLGYLMQGVEKDENGKYTDKMDGLYLVREMFQKGSKTYCSEEKFEALDYLTIDFKTDTATTVHLYFKNCWVQVTKEGFKQHDYSKLDGYIWERQVIDKDFNPPTEKDALHAEFNTFLQLAMCGAEEVKTAEGPAWKVLADDKSKTKYLSSQTAFGYGVSRHKNRAMAKAIVCVDRKLRHGGNESNGGSGKGIFFTAMGKLRNTLNIDGKVFKFDSNFPYTMISEDHEFIHFEDVKKGFDIEMLFNPITGGWEIRRLHENSYQIPFEKSAKIGISTNFSLRGAGSSFLRRQHILEFSNFFNEKLTPLDHFGHMLFDDWDEPEWNRFYAFTIICIQKFLEHGLVEFPADNYSINKLVDTAGEAFVEWMDEKFGFYMDDAGNTTHNSTQQIYLFDNEYERDEIFKAFKDSYPTTKRYQMDQTNSFTGWVKEWCKQRDIEFIQRKPGHKNLWKFCKPQNK